MGILRRVGGGSRGMGKLAPRYEVKLKVFRIEMRAAR